MFDFTSELYSRNINKAIAIPIGTHLNPYALTLISEILNSTLQYLTFFNHMAKCSVLNHCSVRLNITLLLNTLQIYSFFFNSASLLHKKHTFLCNTAYKMHKIETFHLSALRHQPSDIYHLPHHFSICRQPVHLPQIV